ncbi:MAG: hypothetical protein ACOCYC_02545 [bacterium]
MRLPLFSNATRIPAARIPAARIRAARIPALVVLLAVAVAALGFTESVMVSVRADEEYSGEEDVGFYLSSVEAGIMDVLFDMGHIVFNRSRHDAVSSTAEVVEIAADGGAGYVVDAVVDFAGRRDSPVLRDVEYAWLQIGAGKAPRRETVSAKVLSDEEAGSTEEAGYNLGRRVGAAFSEHMQ